MAGLARQNLILQNKQILKEIVFHSLEVANEADCFFHIRFKSEVIHSIYERQIMKNWLQYGWR